MTRGGDEPVPARRVGEARLTDGLVSARRVGAARQVAGAVTARHHGEARQVAGAVTARRLGEARLTDRTVPARRGRPMERLRRGTWSGGPRGGSDRCIYVREGGLYAGMSRMWIESDL